jgi:protease-4
MMRSLAAALAMLALGGLVVLQSVQVSRADSASTAQPSDDSATTQPSNHLLTPAELIAKMKARRVQEESQPRVAYFDLDEPVSEKPADFSFFANADTGLTLRVLIDRLEQARQDKGIRAVLITLGDPELNLSQAMELRSELQALSKDGKRTFVYADEYDTSSYVAATGATDICMMDGGEIMIPGVGFETMFAKGLLDKVGVKADYVQIGEYKGADEEYTRTEASPELTGELNKLADSLYGQIIAAISSGRKLPTADVQQIVDQAMIPAADAKQHGLIDHLVEMDDLRQLLADQLGQKVDLLHHYAETKADQVDLSSPFALFSLLSRKPTEPTRDCVAIIYAEGVIVDGTADQGIMSGASDNIGSEDFREAIREARRDDKTKAVVIRIDSPGGSALASEVMWQSVRELAKEKPVIISVGSMAASGGYYLASSGDYIFADPTAIVGSIGVVGGKFVLKDLFAKVGLNTQSFLRGKNADLFSESTEWDDQQRQQVTNWMKETYDQFTQRVMTTRSGKIKDIDAVARGRIFSASQAKDLGMIDEIGGVQAAIAYAAGQTDLRPGEYDVQVLPPARTLADMFSQDETSDDDDSGTLAPMRPKVSLNTPTELSAFLASLPAPLRHATSQQLQILMLLQQRPVILASPYALIVR